MPEAAAFGDIGKCKIGGKNQLLSPQKSPISDKLPETHSQSFTKADLHASLGKTDCFRYILVGNCFRKPLANKSNRVPYRRIGNATAVGGFANHNFIWRDENWRVWRGLSINQKVEQLSCLKANAHMSPTDTRKVGCGNLAKGEVIIDANHRYLLRNRQPHRSTGFKKG